jgi:endo-1,4-beta-mannosidase
MKHLVRAIGTIALGLFLCGRLSAQPSAFVDEKGVLRWTETKEEVCVFGVNLTSPFADTFAAQEFLGVDHEKAIDADVYHLARMGMDGFRVHVWDNDISDSSGNLVLNKHLQLFDYMLHQLKERGIKIILTPMCFYSSGGRDAGTNNGFQKYFDGKKGCLTDTNSFVAQERYLSQFVSHVNPYTGLAYKDDPDIIAFEINNEPFNHADRPDLATYYINRMAAAIKSTGCRKPLFYNMRNLCKSPET